MFRASCGGGACCAAGSSTMTAMMTRAASRALALAFLASLSLAGCGITPEYDEFTVFDPKEQRLRDRTGTFTGRDGITIFSSANRKAALEEGGGGGGGGGIGVNAFLWRGALETLNFMPLASADPFGGLIITDWYQPATAPDERLKVHVLILDRTLRADAVKVSVFRQVRNGGAEWVEQPVDPKTAVEIEDKILTKARELRIASLETAG
jgi:hypothetical protein